MILQTTETILKMSVVRELEGTVEYSKVPPGVSAVDTTCTS
jgi:hypothetical protein